METEVSQHLASTSCWRLPMGWGSPGGGKKSPGGVEVGRGSRPEAESWGQPVSGRGFRAATGEFRPVARGPLRAPETGHTSQAPSSAGRQRGLGLPGQTVTATTKASREDRGRGKEGIRQGAPSSQRAERAGVMRMERGWENRGEAPGVPGPRLRPWGTWSSLCRSESRETAGLGSGWRRPWVPAAGLRWRECRTRSPPEPRPWRGGSQPPAPQGEESAELTGR